MRCCITARAPAAAGGRGLKSEPSDARARIGRMVPAFCGSVCWTSADLTVCHV